LRQAILCAAEALCAPTPERPVIPAAGTFFHPQSTLAEPHLPPANDASGGILSLGDIALADATESAGCALCGISEPGGDHCQSADGRGPRMNPNGSSS
jgi:hypothetical protein